MRLTMEDTMDKSRLVFFDATHQYYLDGKELTAVSYVFERTFIVDFRKIDFEILERARLIGDYVHEMCALRARGELDEETVDFSLAGYLKAYDQYLAENVKQIVRIEEPVYSSHFGYAGTPDIVYIDHDGYLCLDDYKTAETLHPAVALQTAAYAYAYERTFKEKIRRRGGVQLNADGTYYRKKLTASDDFDNFIAALRVTHYKIKNKIRS